MKLIIVFDGEKDVPDQVVHVGADGMTAAMEAVRDHLLESGAQHRGEAVKGGVADTVRINLVCWQCHLPMYVNPATEQYCPHCGVKAIHTLSLGPTA